MGRGALQTIDSEKAADSGDSGEGEDGEESDEETDDMNFGNLDESELAERESNNSPEPRDSAEDLIKREKQLQQSI